MYLKQHFFFGLVFAATLFLLFPIIGFLGFSIIFLSSVLIDFDHYLFYTCKKRNLNIKKAYNSFIKEDKYCRSLPWEERNKLPRKIFIFHGIEVLAILFFLSFVFNYFIFIFVGFGFHLLLDLIDQTTYWDKNTKFSTIYDVIKYRKENCSRKPSP